MFKFPKNERLCSKKLIEILFSEGKSFLVFPLKVTYIILEDKKISAPVQVLILASRKRFKKATHRNRIKRLIREAYRLEKKELSDLIACHQKNCLVAFSYVSDNELPFSVIRQSMILALNKIKENLNQ